MACAYYICLALSFGVAKLEPSIDAHAKHDTPDMANEIEDWQTTFAHPWKSFAERVIPSKRACFVFPHSSEVSSFKIPRIPRRVYLAIHRIYLSFHTSTLLSRLGPLSVNSSLSIWNNYGVSFSLRLTHMDDT